MPTLNRNKEQLTQRIFELGNKSVYTCLEVYTRGNKCYLLNDLDSQILVIVVPSAPLSWKQSDAVIKMGFTEEWEKVNYVCSIDALNSEELQKLIDTIENLFVEVLKLGSAPVWRYTLNTGMGAIKNLSEPIPTVSESRGRNKKNRYSIKNLLLKNALALFIVAVLFFTLINERWFTNWTIGWFLFVFVMPFVFIKALPLLDYLNYANLRQKIFLGNRSARYFEQHSFTKVGQRYVGNIDGYRVELLYNELDKYSILVYHKPLDWERVLELPHTKIYQTTSYNWTGVFYSKKCMGTIGRKANLLQSAADFVEMHKELKIES